MVHLALNLLLEAVIPGFAVLIFASPFPVDFVLNGSAIVDTLLILVSAPSAFCLPLGLCEDFLTGHQINERICLDKVLQRDSLIGGVIGIDPVVVVTISPSNDAWVVTKAPLSAHVLSHFVSL